MRQYVFLLVFMSVASLVSCVSTGDGSRSPAAIGGGGGGRAEIALLDERAKQARLPLIPEYLHQGDRSAVQFIVNAIEAYSFLHRHEQIFGSVVVKKIAAGIATTVIRRQTPIERDGHRLMSYASSQGIEIDPNEIEKMAHVDQLAIAVHSYLGFLDTDYKNATLFRNLYLEQSKRQ